MNKTVLEVVAALALAAAPLQTWANSSKDVVQALAHCKDEQERSQLVALLEKQIAVDREERMLEQERSDKRDANFQKFFMGYLAAAGAFTAWIFAPDIKLEEYFNTPKSLVGLAIGGSACLITALAILEKLFESEQTRISRHIALKKTQATKALVDKAFAAGDYKAVTEIKTETDKLPVNITVKDTCE